MIRLREGREPGPLAELDVTRAPVQATIKALARDGSGRLLMMQEESGLWDLPGGRLEPGESLSAALVRECEEEIGAPCRVLDTAPTLAWAAADLDGFWRVMLCFRVEVSPAAIRPSGECVELRFVTPAELRALDLYPQTRPLLDLIR